MRGGVLMLLGGLLVAALVAGALFLLVPREYLDLATVASVSWLAAACFAMFLAPAGLMRSGFSGDAATMARLGPAMLSTLLVLAVAVAAVWTALEDAQAWSLALTVISFGLFLFGMLVDRGTAQVVSHVAATYSQPSAHLRWSQELSLMAAATADPVIRATIGALAEKLRYSPSDHAGQSPFAPDIAMAIAGLAEAASTQDVDAAKAAAGSCDSLIDRRALALAALRSKA